MLFLLHQTLCMIENPDDFGLIFFPKLYILSTIKSVLLLWYTKLILCAEIFNTAPTAQSAQKQKGTRFISVFIVLGIYTFDFSFVRFSANLA